MCLSEHDWQWVRRQLKPDGSLRDIYVFNADRALWRRFLSGLEESSYPHRFILNYQVLDRPVTSYEQAEALSESSVLFFQIDIGPGVFVNGNFLALEEIELNADPGEMDDNVCYERLVRFMRWLAGIVARPVILTHENSPREIILHVQANGEMTAPERDVEESRDGT